jgi:hypothetical protein
MTTAVADPPAAVISLFFETGIGKYQGVDPDLFVFRAPARA